MNLMALHPRDVAYVAEAYLVAGRPADAMESVQRALQLSRAHKQRWVEAETLRILGEIQSSQELLASEEAETSCREALALADQLGMRPLVAHCHLGLGKLYRHTGDKLKAQEHLTTAATMYREMDMGFWPQQAEAALGSLPG